MRILTLLLLGGCGVGLDGYNPHTGDTDAPLGDVYITGISPWWGPTAGGTLITISGSGFTGVEEVLLDELSVEFFREDAETIYVTTPAHAGEGPVAVSIVAGDGTASEAEGFWYSDSGQPDRGDVDPDTSGGGGGGGGTPTGLYGGLIEIGFEQIACPSCIGATSSLQINAAAAFHQPSPTGWTGSLPARGSCVVNPTGSAPSTARIDVGEWVYLESGGSSIGLRRTSGTGGMFYDGGAIAESSYVRNASFELNVNEGGSLGSFSLAGALVTTEGFTEVAPYELLYSDVYSAFSAAISQYGQTFQWAPAGGNGGFLVRIGVYSEDGSAFLGQIDCMGNDTGALTVPSAYLAAFPSYSLVTVGMYRHRVTETVLPSNGATLQAISTHGFQGTGTLVPW